MINGDISIKQANELTNRYYNENKTKFNLLTLDLNKLSTKQTIMRVSLFSKKHFLFY